MIGDVVGKIASNVQGSIIASRISDSPMRDAHLVRETHVDLTITKPFHSAIDKSDTTPVPAGSEAGATAIGEIDDRLAEVAVGYREKLGLREQDLLVVGDFVSVGVDIPKVIRDPADVPEDFEFTIQQIPQWRADRTHLNLQQEDPKHIAVVFSRRFKLNK